MKEAIWCEGCMIIPITIRVEIDPAIWRGLYGRMNKESLIQDVKEYVAHAIETGGAGDEGAILSVKAS